MRKGDFADAKGEEYAELLSKKIGLFVMIKLMSVTIRHLEAASARGAALKIYFTEKKAADYVRDARRFHPILFQVKIGFIPPSKPKKAL